MFLLSKKKLNLKKCLSVRSFLPGTIFLAGLVFELVGCSVSGPIWKNHGDSCISISKIPPLKRVINYTDHDLCERKLSPRKAPNPQTRANKIKE